MQGGGAMKINLSLAPCVFTLCLQRCGVVLRSGPGNSGQFSVNELVQSVKEKTSEPGSLSHFKPRTSTMRDRLDGRPL